MNKGRLIFFCGKMGAGKSTKSLEITKINNAVLLSEDEWLMSLYPNKIKSLDDYLKYSNQIKPQIKRLAQSILITGTDVVMDFPANTLAQREWLRGVFLEINAPHELIFIDTPNEICLKQIMQRNIQQPERAVTDTKEMFDKVTKYFVEPLPEEGFNVTKLNHVL